MGRYPDLNKEQTVPQTDILPLNYIFLYNNYLCKINCYYLKIQISNIKYQNFIPTMWYKFIYNNYYILINILNIYLVFYIDKIIFGRAIRTPKNKYQKFMTLPIRLFRIYS